MQGGKNVFIYFYSKVTIKKHAPCIWDMANFEDGEIWSVKQWNQLSAC